APSKAGCVESKDAATCLDQGAPRESVVDRKIEPDEPVDSATLPGAPLTSHCAYETQARRHTRARSPDREHNPAGPKPGGGAGFRRLEPRDLGAEHGEVDGVVAPCENGGCGSAIRQCQGDVFFPADRVARRDDHARAPDDAARWYATPSVNGDYGSAGPL